MSIEIRNKLDKFIESNSLPHILFHGENINDSIRKTDYIVDKIYSSKEEKMKYCLYVNCAYGKGIKFIREQLKYFAQTNIDTNKQFKSIVLLHADFLTIDAQSALRRCIELYSKNTRFFMVVLNKNTIIKPIQSRFCDIYIGTINQNIIDENSKLKELAKSRCRYLKRKLRLLPDKNLNIFDLAIDIYNYGIFYQDFINVFKDTIKDQTILYGLITYLNKLRIHIKYEPLLFHNIINIYCLRNNVEFENIYPF